MCKSHKCFQAIHSLHHCFRFSTPVVEYWPQSHLLHSQYNRIQHPAPHTLIYLFHQVCPLREWHTAIRKQALPRYICGHIHVSVLRNEHGCHVHIYSLYRHLCLLSSTPYCCPTYWAFQPCYLSHDFL